MLNGAHSSVFYIGYEKTNVENVFTTSVIGKTNVECAYNIDFGQNWCSKYSHNIGFDKTNVVNTLSTSILDKSMLFFTKKK